MPHQRDCWAQFRDAQRDGAGRRASALALDEIARREQITVTREDVDKEIEQLATRSGRTAAALRAQLEKEGGISRLYAGLRLGKARLTWRCRVLRWPMNPPRTLVISD